MNKNSLFDHLDYDVCSIILNLLEKAKGNLTKDEEVQYLGVTALISTIKTNFLTEEIQGLISLKEHGYLTNEMIEEFLKTKPELVGTKIIDNL